MIVFPAPLGEGETETGATLHELVDVEVMAWDAESGALRAERRRTTIGRIIFNQILPDQLRFHDQVMRRVDLKALVDVCYRQLGADETAIPAAGMDPRPVRPLVRSLRRAARRAWRAARLRPACPVT